MGRTNLEQRLKTDIHEKNTIARSLRRTLRQIEKFRRRSPELKGRWKERYLTTAARLEEGARKVAKEIIASGEDLQRRMVEEQKISESEVQAFEERFEKERAEHRAAMEKANKSMELYEQEAASLSWWGASEEERKNLHKLEDEAYKARAKVIEEGKDVRKALKELSSEAKDKAFFKLELERIAAERIALKGLAAPSKA